MLKIKFSAKEKNKDFFESHQLVEYSSEGSTGKTYHEILSNCRGDISTKFINFIIKTF